MSGGEHDGILRECGGTRSGVHTARTACAESTSGGFSRDGGETYDAGGPVLFEYVTGGVVSGMVPSEGPVGGGTRVQVVGEHFKAGRETGCLFGREGRMQWGGGSRARWCTARVR